jgi:hypothetical protein
MALLPVLLTRCCIRLHTSSRQVVVMSATLDAGKFQTYFDSAPLLKVRGDVPLCNFLTASFRTVVRWTPAGFQTNLDSAPLLKGGRGRATL